MLTYGNHINVLILVLKLSVCRVTLYLFKPGFKRWGRWEAVRAGTAEATGCQGWTCKNSSSIKTEWMDAPPKCRGKRVEGAAGPRKAVSVAAQYKIQPNF